MFKKVICQSCKHTFDGMLEECPHCHAKNIINKEASRFKNIAFLGPIKQIALFLIGWAVFQLLGFLISSIFELYASSTFGFETSSYFAFLNSYKTNMLINTVMYLIITVACLLLLWKDYTKLLNSFKSWKPFVAAIVGVAAIITFNLMYNVFLIAVNAPVADNANESAVTSLTKAYPLIAIVVFGFIGPLCEELTYRLGLFSFFMRTKKWIAYLLTIILFTFIHFDFTLANPIVELLNIPFYAFAAFTFCFIYDRFGFAGSLYCHITNNLFSVIMSLIPAGMLLIAR